MDERVLILDLFDAGLLQFGRFLTRDGVRPFQHHMNMLASYPNLLRRVAHGLAGQGAEVDRLLCNQDCIPLSVAMSLETGVPLVVGRGGVGDGARDFVGAYDIGHPAALVVHGQGDVNALLVQHAGRFGLDVRWVLAVLDDEPKVIEVPTHALLDLGNVVDVLIEEGRIPGPLGAAVLDWLQEEATRRRPDSAGP
ncbi:MAG: hypothetical protein U0452_00625 [Anaerolineae bacterium]